MAFSAYICKKKFCGFAEVLSPHKEWFREPKISKSQKGFWV
jgi:hypothetical protein